MKRLITILIVCILMSSMALAASVSRDIPSRISPGEAVTVKLNINSVSLSDTVKTFAIEESLPEGFTISDWSITGAQETKEVIKTQFVLSDCKFEFTPTGSSATITYTTTAPTTEGSYEFKATWFDLSGMSGVNDGKSTVTVRTITCGDGVCEGDETFDNCEADCPKGAEPSGEIVGVGAVNTGWIIVAVIVIVGLIIYFASTKKKKRIKA